MSTVVIIIGYILMSSAVTNVVYVFNDPDQSRNSYSGRDGEIGFNIFLGVIWPLTILGYSVYTLFYAIPMGVKNYVNKLKARKDFKEIKKNSEQPYR